MRSLLITLITLIVISIGVLAHLRINNLKLIIQEQTLVLTEQTKLIRGILGR